MPEIISVSKLDMPYRIPQKVMRDFAVSTFSGNFPDTERLLPVFENSDINERNLCVPLEYFNQKKSFAQRNNDYLKLAVDMASEVILKCISDSGFDKNDITDFIYISSTGISTPSPDAYIINRLKLNNNINRYPLWGLGCAGGAAGTAKAGTIAKADPDSLVLVVTCELCSLTFLSGDYTKSNFVATSLFSDGVAAVLVKGDGLDSDRVSDKRILIKDSASNIYYDSIDVMGWDVTDEGLKVIFSKDIPSIVENNLKPEIDKFLLKSNLAASDIKNYITHPGGVKVIDSYIRCLELEECSLNITRETLRNYGNMSSATVLYVLDNFVRKGLREGPGLMTSLGPGFSSEMVLLDIEKSDQDG
ncbi:MAG: type III polyketide synthase [Bacteroidetes bacterium]|nr:type III polyketide synthase [Bacteroidota bacterium]